MDRVSLGGMVPMKKYTVELEEGDNGDVLMPLPEEVIAAMSLEPGDALSWSDQGDGSYVLQRQHINPFADQRRFMMASDQSVDKNNDAQFLLYYNLVKEEMAELMAAVKSADRIETLDALVDILVVTIGAMLSMGANAEGAWQEVMRSNLAKIDPETGRVQKRSDGKVMKPPGWQPPDLKPYLEK